MDIRKVKCTKAKDFQSPLVSISYQSHLRFNYDAVCIRTSTGTCTPPALERVVTDNNLTGTRSLHRFQFTSLFFMVREAMDSKFAMVTMRGYGYWVGAVQKEGRQTGS